MPTAKTKAQRKYLLAHLSFILALLRSMGYTVKVPKSKGKRKGGKRRRSHKQILATKKLIAWNRKHPGGGAHRKKKRS